MPLSYHSMDISNKLIWNLRDMGHTIRYMSEGRGSQKRILIILNKVGMITQSDLTEHLGIQSGSASEVIGKLENAGLLIRTSNPADHRTTILQLSERGKIQAIEAEYTDALTQRQYIRIHSTEDYFIGGWSKANEIKSWHLYEQFMGLTGSSLIEKLPEMPN